MGTLLTLFGCAGCVVTGTGIILGGPAAWIAAGLHPGSTVAVAACVGACASLF